LGRLFPLALAVFASSADLFRLAGRVALDGILETYNLFNHENFGNYEVRESNANFGQPIPILSIAYLGAAPPLT